MCCWHLDLSISIHAFAAITSLSPMRKSSNCDRRLLLFLAVVIFPTVKITTATDVRSQPSAVANDPLADAEIPAGFKLERYARVWERNPFTLITPSAPQAQHSAFDKLFLTSWLKDGRTDVIFIQNLETNEVQKITSEANQDNLRLIALHLNPNPQFVEAVISDGKEQGPVKFRLDVQSSVAQSASPPAQVTNKGAVAQPSNPAQAAFATLPRPQVNPPNAQTSGLPATAPVDQPLTRRLGSGTPRAQFQGGPGPAPRGESEGVRLPRPGKTSGQSMSGKS
jgi:hypothetical protein